MKFLQSKVTMEEKEQIEQKDGNFVQRHFRKVFGKFKFYFKKYGWKFGVAIVLFYLVRDTILYIIVPYLIAKHFID